MNPGTPANILYEVTHRGLEARRCTDYLPGRVGHAIGLGSHGYFSINASYSLVLIPSVIVTLEPHIRRLHNSVLGHNLITTDGHKYLTPPPCGEDLGVNLPIFA